MNLPHANVVVVVVEVVDVVDVVVDGIVPVVEDEVFAGPGTEFVDVLLDVVVVVTLVEGLVELVTVVVVVIVTQPPMLHAS